MSAWKLIHTAKKEDYKILWLYQDMRPTGGKYVFRGSWSSDRKGWVCWEGGSAPWNVEPTHWQPYRVPKPPKEGKPSQQKSPSFIEDLGNGVEKHDLVFRIPPAKEGKQS